MDSFLSLEWGGVFSQKRGSVVDNFNFKKMKDRAIGNKTLFFFFFLIEIIKIVIFF